MEKILKKFIIQMININRFIIQIGSDITIFICDSNRLHVFVNFFRVVVNAMFTFVV